MKISTKNPLLKDISAHWIESWSKEQKEPSWVTERRLKAWDIAQKLPWPDARNEHWRRSSIPYASIDSLELGGNPTVLNTPPKLTKSLSAFAQSQRQNGHNAIRYHVDLNEGSYLQMPDAFSKEGVQWIPWSQALKEHAELLKTSWDNALVEAEKNKFLALTLALGAGGTYLVIPRNKSIKAPLQRLLSSAGQPKAQFTLNFISVESGAEAHIWEELMSPDQPDTSPQNTIEFISSFTMIHVGDSAIANFYNLQHWGNRTIHLQFQDTIQGAHSRLNTVALAVGGQTFHQESILRLAGEGAENKVLGVLFGDKNQNFVNWITQNHVAKRTTSDIQYRGALKGSSKSFFSGLVSITKEAQQSDAYQGSKSLLLSKDARADAIPNLEILADDVKCAHGAAVGSVDEDQKFYLQTRGVAPEDAEEIIVEGFFEPVISAVPSEEVQERLRAFIERKMENP